MWPTIDKLWRALSNKALRKTVSRRRAAIRCPMLEALEDRLAPANYTVNALTDTGSGNGTTGDLRYCILQADSNPGSTIVFDNAVFAAPQTITLTNGGLGLTQNVTIA